MPTETTPNTCDLMVNGERCGLYRDAHAHDEGSPYYHHPFTMPQPEPPAPTPSATELLPCPFCGCKPYRTRTVNGTQMLLVGCAACGYEFKAAWYRGEPAPTKDIEAVWNSRVSPASAPAATPDCKCGHPHEVHRADGTCLECERTRMPRSHRCAGYAAATPEPEMTWQCANCHAVLPVSPIIAERGGPMRCTACDGKGTKHYDRRPARPTGEEAETERIRVWRARLDTIDDGEATEIGNEMLDALTAQATELAALRARESDAESERAMLMREREGRSFWMALALEFGRYLTAEQIADARKAVSEARAALAPRQTTGDEHA